MLKDTYQFFADLFSRIGLSDFLISLLIHTIYLLVIAGIAWASDYFGKRIIHSIIKRISLRTKTDWDDILVERRFFRRLAGLLPALVVYFLFPILFPDYPFWVNLVSNLAQIYMVIVAVMTINSFLSSVNDIYKTFDVSKDKPIKGYLQVVQILIYLFALVFIISILINKNPLYLFTGLGAFMAILVLVFKDPIQGLVAGMQISSNDMVRIGDWITMQRYGADGDVMEINLATVKVRNFDNTIVSIPTYSMITDSFQNWRGMQEADGRRFKRALHIDMTSARFVDQELLDRLRKFRIIREYIDNKQADIDRHNLAAAFDDESPVQYYGRRQTNLGIFRAYVEAYLRNHPKVNANMLLMVRQLHPTEKGIPLEVYAFTKTKSWVEYESNQADIFDHLISVIPEFDLHLFQEPTGQDLSKAFRSPTP